MKAISIGWGSKLHMIDGARMHNVVLTFSKDTAATQPKSSYNSNTGVGGNNWIQLLHGGECSLMPGGYSNHKAGAFFFGEFYYGAHNVSENSDFYLLKWDGSGIHKMGGFTGTNGYAANWRNGRGITLLTPSGSHNLELASCAHIVHNGILFVLGSASFYTFGGGTDPMRDKLGWYSKDYTNASDISDRRRRRRYMSLHIEKADRTSKERRQISTPVEFLPIANKQDDTHACDAISFGSDIIFASYCDIVRFPGASGAAKLVESNLAQPTSKCFDVFPTSGYDGTGTPIGSTNLLCLYGSGVLRKIDFPAAANHVASGTISLIDLANEFTLNDLDEPNNRTGDTLVRVTDTELEPIRSCYLKSFNNDLHAFFISATSGYHYFRCSGDPSNSDNWSNYTNDIPEDIRKFDGDLYAYYEPFRDSLYFMHAAKSEYGVWGEVGGQKGAGGVVVYEFNTGYTWNEMYKGCAAEPPMGIFKYDNFGVYVQAPSGFSGLEVLPSTDYALIGYSLFSTYPTSVSVLVEYSIDNGVSWHTARRFKSYVNGQELGDGRAGLYADYFGRQYHFYWDYVSDLGFNTINQAIIRIIPRIER